MDWYPSVLYSNKAGGYEWFDALSHPLKLESHGYFDMHGDYVDWTIVQDNELLLFDANKYDDYDEFTTGIYVCHAATLKDQEHSILPLVTFNIS